MSTQDVCPVAAHGLPDHQPQEHGSPVSSMSVGDEVAEHDAPLLDETRPTTRGPHEQMSSMARLPSVSDDRSSRTGSARPEPTLDVQPVDQDPELAGEYHHELRSEAGRHTGTREGGYKYISLFLPSMND
jgi:hypothetical protein